MSWGTSTRRKSKRWQRDKTVTGTRLTSVVAKMNLTCSGGSSSVFKKRVEGALREHVDFVDDVDLVARDQWSVARALDDLANIIDAGVRGRVHLDHIGVAGLDDFLAMGAVASEVDGRLVGNVRPGIVQGPRQNARCRRLADPAHAGQHVTLGDAIGSERVAQRRDHRLLSDQVIERLGAVLARQHDIGLLGRAVVVRL